MPVRPGLATLLCLPLLLSACSEGREPEAEPTQPVTVETSTTPTPTEPSVPPEARGSDEASAKAFVRYWFEVFSDAMVTGETNRLAEISAPGCRSCKGFKELIDATYAAGGSIQSDGWITRRIGRRPERSGMVFDVRIQVADERFLRADGTVDKSTEGGPRDVNVWLVRRGDSWKLRQLEVYK